MTINALRWSDIFFSKLQTLLGERGVRADQAVRWRDLTMTGTSSTTIVATDPRVPAIIEDVGGIAVTVGTISDDLATARAIADQAATDALAAGLSAQGVRTDLDALVLGFTGTLAESFAALDGQLTTISADLGAIYDSTTGQVRAAALSGYYTSAGTDSAISAAVDSFEAEFRNPADGQILASAMTAYYTAAQTTGAIAAAQTTLQASIDVVSESVQGWQRITDAVSDVTVGAAVTVTLGGPALGQSGTVIIAEGATARTTNGTPNGANIAIPSNRAVLFSGQRIKIGVLARAPATNAAMKFGVAYSTNDNGNSGYMASAANLTTTWAWHTFYYDVATAVAGGGDYLSIFGDDSKTGKATEVARVFVEIAAVAGEMPEINTLSGQITDIQGLDIAALTGTAFGAFLTELDVQADGQSAVVLAQGSAIADLEGNASAGYLIRAQAGGAVSLIDLVAADDGVTPPTSVVRIAATDILLDGSVAMSQLVVTDLSGNLLGNGDFAAGDLRGWTLTGAISVVANDGSTNAPTAYFARFEPNVGGAAFGMSRAAQGCIAGERFTASFSYLGVAASSGILRLRSTWYDHAGVVISTSDVSASISGATSGGWLQMSGQVTAPASATSVVFTIFRAAPSGGYTGEGALWVADASVIRQRSGAVLITPNSVSANEMVVGTITAGSGILATAAVGTLTIAGNAVTLPVTSYTAAEVLIANSVETTIAQLTIARFAGQPTRIGFCCGHYKYGGEYTRCDFIIYRGATELFRVSEQILSTAEAAVSFFFTDTDLSGGSATYYVKAIPTFQGPAYARRRSIEAHIYKR